MRPISATCSDHITSDCVFDRSTIRGGLRQAWRRDDAARADDVRRESAGWILAHMVASEYAGFRSLDQRALEQECHKANQVIFVRTGDLRKRPSRIKSHEDCH